MAIYQWKIMDFAIAGCHSKDPRYMPLAQALHPELPQAVQENYSE